MKTEEDILKDIYIQTIKNFLALIEKKIIVEPEEFLEFEKNIDNVDFKYTKEKNLELLDLFEKALKPDNSFEENK